MSDINWPQDNIFSPSSFDVEDAPPMDSLNDTANTLDLPSGIHSYTRFMPSHSSSQRNPQVPRIDIHFADNDVTVIPSVTHFQSISHVSSTATLQAGVSGMPMGNYSMLTSSAPAAPFGYAEAKPIQGLVSSYGLHPIDVRFPIMLASPSSRISHSHSPACESYNFDPDQQSSHEQHVGHRRARRRHIEEWKSIQDTTIMATGTSIFIPQKIYKPHTVADQRRCIEEAELMGYIAFENQHPRESGVPLIDALRSSCKHLIDKEDVVFEGEGPSVSIRIQWPGYASWTRQIPTKDFRTPKQPITREKLAKNIANCVKRFIEGMEKKPMEDDEDPKWRVHSRNGIRLEDLILVSLHHVSQGSWQPQLRLRRPL